MLAAAGRSQVRIYRTAAQVTGKCEEVALLNATGYHGRQGLRFDPQLRERAARGRGVSEPRVTLTC